MKKPIGSQFSFSNLDGARASISSEDRLSISFERQEAVEVDEEEGTKEEKEWTGSSYSYQWTEEEKRFDEWVKKNWGKYPPFHRDELEEKWKKWKEQMKEEKEEEEKEEKNETTDPTSTLGSSRNPTDPCTSEITTEPIDVNRCQRPLQRARERREARLQKERDAHAVIDPDHHDPGSQRSRVSCDLEQDRSQLKCDRCNNRLTDSDWSKIKSKGWDAEIVEHAPFCSSCIDQWRVL